MHQDNQMNMGSSMNNGMMAEMGKMLDGMHQMQMTGNVDNDFAMMMKSHHEGAINMSNMELSSGNDETLKRMAGEIIEEQKSEINELSSFLDSNNNPKNNYDPSKKDSGFAKGMDRSMNMMMNIPEMDAETSVDKQYANMMILHHQSAISMAEGYIQHGKDGKHFAMAKKMIADQNKEIEELKKWNDNQQ